ncbi:MAG: hypothetical protein RLZ10_308 [Bacteroidota bacterium]|jgi:glycosyltransferase involved in cell wall biosynthesis
MTIVYPKISIITPSFNQGNYIEETINSILNQGYPNLEYIIIDGGSSDNSVEIIKRYAEKITFWVSEKDSGQSEAINKGLQRSTGDIITWICSDDLLLPGSLFRAAELFIQHPDAGLIHGKTIMFGNGKKDHIKGAHLIDLPLGYFASIPFPQPSSFFTKSALEKTGLLDSKLHYAMDYDFFIRMAFNFDFIACDDIFSKYRLHEDSKSVSQLPQFSSEWTLVFSRFINSVSCPEKVKIKLISETYLNTSVAPFIHSKKYTDSEITTICSLFLFNQLIVWYNLLDKRKSISLIDLIRDIDYKLYKRNGLWKMKMKIKYLPPFIFKLLRKIKR